MEREPKRGKNQYGSAWCLQIQCFCKERLRKWQQDEEEKEGDSWRRRETSYGPRNGKLCLTVPEKWMWTLTRCQAAFGASRWRNIFIFNHSLGHWFLICDLRTSRSIWKLVRNTHSWAQHQTCWRRNPGLELRDMCLTSPANENHCSLTKAIGDEAW